MGYARQTVPMQRFPMLLSMILPLSLSTILPKSNKTPTVKVLPNQTYSQLLLGSTHSSLVRLGLPRVTVTTRRPLDPIAGKEPVVSWVSIGYMPICTHPLNLRWTTWMYTHEVCTPEDTKKTEFYFHSLSGYTPRQ